MSFWREKWPNVKNLINRLWSKIVYLVKSNKKMSLIGGASALLLIVSGLFAYNYYASKVDTLYHVMLDGKDIGLVSETEVVTDWTNELLEESQEKYPGVPLRLSGTITFQAEDIYKGKDEDKKVLQMIESQVKVIASATKVVVNGEVIGYIKDDATLRSVLNEIQNSFGVKGKDKMVTAAGYNGDQGKTGSQKEVLEVTVKDNIGSITEEVNPEQILSPEQVKDLLVKGTLEEKKHVVREGDCLGCIANSYGMTTKDLLRINPGLTEDTILKIGQEVNITAYESKIHVETIEQLIAEESIDYEIKIEKNDGMFYGESKVVQAGKEGTKKVTYKVVKENGAVVTREKLTEVVVSEPVTKIVAKGTKIVPARGTGRFLWPANGGRISSGFGYRWGSLHAGIDIAGASNKSIMAADAGVVESAGWNGGYGNCIIIDHRNGYKTLYGHLSSIKVSEGQKVGKGQVIGVMGSTGHSTGVHLHFEVIKNGTKVNPLPYLR